MDNNLIQIAKNNKSLIHKMFLLIPLLVDVSPFFVLRLASFINLNAGQVEPGFVFAVWIFYPAVVGTIMLLVIIWYFYLKKIKPFSRYAIIGIILSIVGIFEPILLGYILLKAMQTI
ncbi:MAG: hypothetical protein ABSD46_12075 [Bacteroidota bacterium]